MTIKEVFRARMLTAIRAKDSVQKNIYRTFVGEIELYEQKAGIPMPDQNIKKMLQDVRKEDEKILETLSEKLTNADIERLNLEVAICSEFLPNQVSGKELAALITEDILSTEHIGKAIGKTKELLLSLKKTADGSEIKSIIEQLRGVRNV